MEIASEIADVQQAIDDLIISYGITKEEVTDKQKQKNDKAGSFSKGLYVNYVEVKEDDKWVEYYRKNADRYPQIK